MKRLFVIFIALFLLAGPSFSQKKEVYKVRTVVIDPGHGGAKPGAQGSRSWEKNITLAVAMKFGKLIEDNYPDVKIIYTRTDDSDISLAERARIANRNKADLFISIHANSHPTSSPTGVETFVMGLSESRANLEVAKKENADILLEDDYKSDSYYQGFDPNSPESYVLLTMFQNEYLNKSLNFAQAVQNQYKQNLKTINRGVKQAELFVLYKTAMPSVLTEIGFISNPGEETFMLSDEGQAKIAICLFNAFMTYKATEDGTPRVANPVYNIKGAPASGKQTETKAAEPKPAVAEEKKVEEKKAPVAEEKPAPVAEQKKVPAVEEAPAPAVAEKKAPVVEEKPAVAEQPKVESVAQEPVAAPPAKPVPSVTLAQREEPAPAKVKEPVTTVEPVESQPVKEEKVAETLQAPVNTATGKNFYTVQFLTSGQPLPEGDAKFDGITGYETYRKGNLYCYSLGRFASFAEARDYCNNIHKLTSFKDAWVKLVKPAADQLQAEKSEQPRQQVQPGQKAMPKQKEVVKREAKEGPKGTVYRVQFCTSPRLMQKGDPDLCGISDFRYARSGRYYVYTCGNYSSLAEAQKRCEKLAKTTPFRDAFVVGFLNGKRISLE